MMGLNLVYISVVPAEADARLVRYDERRPRGAWEYLTDILRQPLDVVLCPSLKWGCRTYGTTRRWPICVVAVRIKRIFR